MTQKHETDPKELGASASPPGPTPLPARPTRPEAVAMTLLGVDYGRRRVGLAVKPAGQDWALPRAVLTVADEAEAIDGLTRAVTESAAAGVVVGLPLNQDPEMAREVKRFCRKARGRVRGARWFFVDEALTSQAADAISLDSPRRRPTDDLAASLILETFLQSCPLAGR
jgi:putative Holliday junction resolvase